MAVIGIDLGTSNSAAAVLKGGRPVLIPGAEGVSLGGKAFPSYVAITADGEVLVGEPARRQAAINPEGTATGFKRLMGKREKVKLRGREFSPEELSSFLLKKIKNDAESFLGESVEKAVITVPAYFDDNQRSATKDAARIAGIEVLRLVNEPTAAALAYGLDRMGQDLRIAVIDLGGGTLDVTLMEFGKGVFEVRATSGDTKLGGTDMNIALFDFLAEAFRAKTGYNLSSDPSSRARLMEATEAAKIELSSVIRTRISLPAIAIVNGEPRHLEMELTRAELERLVTPVIERCRAPVEQTLKDAGITAGQIDRLIFVGGPTRMPVVRSYFERLLGRQSESGVDPMECVAGGAAIQAGVLSGEVQNIVLVDVTPLTLGVETLGGVATSLVARNTPVPVRKTETFTTAADMQTAVTVHVFQGERPFARDNTSLGEFNLDGIPPAPRGIPKIEVTFEIDANGILNVSAKDLGSGRSQSIRITGSTRLSDEEKSRMIKEAEKYAAEDRRRKEEAEKLNEADSLCYQADKTIADFGDKIPADIRSRLDAAVKTVREAHAKKDLPALSSAVEALKKVLQEAGSAVYSQAQAQSSQSSTQSSGFTAGGPGAAATSEPSTSSKDNEGRRVVDAEYH